jgi:hypothetical protein
MQIFPYCPSGMIVADSGKNAITALKVNAHVEL